MCLYRSWRFTIHIIVSIETISATELNLISNTLSEYPSTPRSMQRTPISHSMKRNLKTICVCNENMRTADAREHDLQ